MLKRMVERKEIGSRNKYSVLCCLLFIIVHVCLISTHEAWRDEAQAWVLVKNSSLPELFSILPSEGHPSLWFIVIYPFVKLGLDFRFFSYISLGFVTVAVFLFLTFGEFPYRLKVVTIFSSIFMYFNPVICRVYSLLVLLVVLLGLVWRKRRNHMIVYGVIIAALFQAHILLCGLAIGCVIDILLIIISKEPIKYRYFSLFISLLSFFLLVLELLPRSSELVTQRVSVYSIILQLNISNIINGFLGVASYSGYVWLGGIVLLAFFCYLFYVLYVAKQEKRISWYLHEIVVILFACMVYFGIICFVYNITHIQIAICFSMIIFISCWILYMGNDERIAKCSKYMLLLITFVSYFSVINGIKNDVMGDFSKSREMANCIIATVNENDILIVENQPTTPTVYAYVSSKYDELMFADISTGKEYTYMQWGVPYIVEHSESEICDFADKVRKDTTSKVYYLSNKNINEEVSFDLIKACDGSNVWKECYYLYLVE